MKQSTRKNIISAIVTIVILALGIGIFRMLSSSKKSTLNADIPKNERRKVSFQTFNPTMSNNLIELDGRLRAHERVTVTSKVQGLMQVTNKSVKEGKFFKRGELLFEVDRQEADFNIKASKSSLQTAITQMMPDLKFDYPESFQQWDDYLKAFDTNKPIAEFPSPISDQEKYFIAGRNLNSQYFQIKSQETRLNDYAIYAPFSGVITTANVYPGALISPGQALCTMINTEQFELPATISLSDLKHVKTGQSVQVKSEDLGKTWNGKVNRIGTQIDQTTQNLPIFIGVRGTNLKDGMYVKATLEGNSLEDVVQLPKDVFISPTEIFVIEDSTLVLKQIESIKREKEKIIIRGLKPEDRVVTSSLAGLFEGQKVTY